MPYRFNPFTTNLDYYQRSGTSMTVDTFTTTGGAQTLTLSNTPTTVVLVILYGQFLDEDAGDYLESSNSITLLNPNIPAGIWVKVAYTY